MTSCVWQITDASRACLVEKFPKISAFTDLIRLIVSALGIMNKTRQIFRLQWGFDIRCLRNGTNADDNWF